MAAKNRLRVTPSSGNVFRDLGFSTQEAAHLMIRADLLIQIQKIATARGVKQAQLAKLLQVSQPRISDLLRGRLHLFNIEALSGNRATNGGATSRWRSRCRAGGRPARRLRRSRRAEAAPRSDG